MKYTNTGDEVRRKWRSLRSGFRRELLARSNKKPKPKTKQWKHFNKLLFLRDSENALSSDNEFDDNLQTNSMCVNHSDNVSTDDFSDLMQLNNSPVPNLTVESIENGEIKFISSLNDKQDKQQQGCQEVNDNTQFKIMQPNIPHNPTLHPQQTLYLVNCKTNGVSDMSPLLLIKKPDQTQTTTTTSNHNQITHEEHHHIPDQQNIVKTITNAPTPTNHRTNELITMNSFKNNNNNVQQPPKTKKRKEECDEDLDANDYFGRMIASLIKDFDKDEANAIRVAILQLLTTWNAKKNHNENNK